MIDEEEEEEFQSSNIWRICEKLIHNDDETVKDHCHKTWNIRGAAHKSSIN